MPAIFRKRYNFRPRNRRKIVFTIAEPLIAGVASFVSSGSDGILVEATPPSGGFGEIFYQWQRSIDGGQYTNLIGAVGQQLLDDDVAENFLYRYKVLQTRGTQTVETNSISAQLYLGGLLTGATIPEGGDPFSLVYEALWNMVSARPEFSAIPDKNLIKFIGNNNNPMKQGQLTADVPEITLLVEAATANLHMDSNSSKVTLNYTWILNSGDFNLAKGINPLSFALIRAMTQWRVILMSLQWEGRNFVQKSNLSSGTIGRSNPEHNNGLKGWTALWGCSVDMVFSNSLLV